MSKTKQNYLGPFIIMVVLMSLIGLITNLNQQFQAPMKDAYMLMSGNLSNTLTVGIVFSFFLAYLVIGPLSTNYIDKRGYKSTLILGLIILIAAFGLYELSAWVFDNFDFPNFQEAINEARVITSLNDVESMKTLAAETGNFQVNVLKSGEFSNLMWLGDIQIPIAYWVFVAAAFVAGTALTFLQAVVNPYLVACEVPGTSGVQRQTIAGAGNSSMTTIGPLIVVFLIFQGKSGLDINITSLYVPIAILIIIVAIIAVLLSRMDLPSIASTAKQKDEVLPKSVWSFRHLTLGVLAIFFYVGVEVCVGSNINLFAISEGFNLEQAGKMASMYWGGMLIGRLMGSFVSKIPANTQLLVTSIGAAVLVAASMVFKNPWLLVGVGLFHSIMWPAIFALAIDGLGRYTSKGSGALMMGVVGGAILPFVQGITADAIGGWELTWAIVVIGEVFLLYYALIGHKVKQRDEILEKV